MWIIIIASASALVLIILLIISVVCILRCRRSKHKIIETEVPMGEDFTSSLIDIPLNRDDPEMLKSGDITKNTTVMSTIVTNTKLTSHKFVHKPSKRTDWSRASQFSINSPSQGSSDRQIPVRKTQCLPRRFPRFSTEQDKKNPISGKISKTSKFKENEETKDQESSIECDEQLDSPRNDSDSKSSPDQNFTLDSYLEGKWDRKRLHRSPDDQELRIPKRKSNWKCDLPDLRAKELHMQFTLKKLGLDK